MGLHTIKIDGVNLDVYFDYKKTNDPYGTGDSPDEHEVEINEIELNDSSVNIKSLLSDSQINELEIAIIRIEND